MKKNILLTLIALFCVVYAQAYDFKSGDLYYDITSSTKPYTVEVTCQKLSYTDYAELTSITIPATVTYNGKTYSVTSIGGSAFSGCTGLTSITIPNSVTTIGDWAFSVCTGLTSIVVESDNIVYDSRNNCNAIVETATNTLIQGCKTTIIPNSVTSIGEYAFSVCTGLTSITIPNSVTEIGESAFNSCTGLTSITIPNSVTSIGGSAFWSCTGLTSITIPNSVTSIGGSAFWDCTGLTSITIPNSVESIGDWAFYGVLNIVYYGTATGSPWSAKNMNGYADGYLVYEDDAKTKLLACSTAATGEIVIPNSVTSIGQYAFARCTGLTSIVVESDNIVYDSRNNCNAIVETATNTLIQGCKTTIIPNSVTSIGWDAFASCTGLTSITIPNSVTSIGGSAFNDCTGLTSVTIGNSVTSIGEWAFKGCTGLASIVVENGNKVYDSRNNCNAIIETTTNTLIQGCKTTIIPNSVTSIGGSAFSDCTSLTSITIPNSVTSIGWDAFARCTGLTSITIPNSVTSIGGSAFAWCTGLTSITIPNSVTSIGGSAFYDCTGLTSITIPNSVTSIGGYAFYDCTGLTSVTIGNSVTSIGGYAFWGCTGLTSITSLSITPPTMDTNVFEEVSTDIPVYVPCGSRDVYSMAEEWKSFTNYIEQLTAIVAITSQDENKGIVTITKQASCEDNECTFVATAKEDYRFVQWSDGNTDNPRTIIVTEDITLTAEFEDTSATNVLQTADNQFTTPQKIVRDGQVYILRNGKTYTTTGVEIK